MKTITSFLVALCVLAIPTLGKAADWPTRPVRLVVPYPAGGNADVVARIVAQGLQDKLHETFIVENKAGAGGPIGVTSVIRSAPDGDTDAAFGKRPILFAPELVNPRPYSWEKGLSTTINHLDDDAAGHPGEREVADANLAKEFLADAKKNGGKVTCEGAGMGTTNHLFSELMQEHLKVRSTTVRSRRR